nr:MAG TPA: Large subunit terminase [Bacteriophage sp.]
MVNSNVIHIAGTPSARQKEFFDSRARFTAYGGARGGGKSWALRRKLVGMCLRYNGLSCLLVRRTLPELKANHVIPFLREYNGLMTYSDSEKALIFSNESRISLGYCAIDRDALRYQGQEYDVIAIDEATQLSEFRFSILKACLRGANHFPKRMYLTCNPGGIGHNWVKRLFIDRDFRCGENPKEYNFIPALVYDNPNLIEADPEYIHSLESLPVRLRDAWLYGRWDVFEGQFFPEFNTSLHACNPSLIPKHLTKFVALDYGFDRLAVLLCGVDAESNFWVVRELCESGLTLSQAAHRVSDLIKGDEVDFAVCSPDLWNRRQDSGLSGAEIMQRVPGMPPMRSADDRRIAGWRVLREYLSERKDSPHIRISSDCRELCECLPALLCDPNRSEDASGEPHRITHAPEALRYAVMSRACAPDGCMQNSDVSIFRDFKFSKPHSFYD